MLCDRDAVYENGPKSVEANISERLRVLPRYHLENYFLHEDILAAVFADMEASGSWLRDPAVDKGQNTRLCPPVHSARDSLKSGGPYAGMRGEHRCNGKGVNQDATIDQLVAKITDRVESEVTRVSGALNSQTVEEVTRNEYERITKLAEFNQPRWLDEIPGRVVFNRFCGSAGMRSGRLQSLYLRQAQNGNHDPFSEIREIFSGFRAAT